MQNTELLSLDRLRQLAETPGPCITIVLSGPGIGNSAAELKDALNKVRRELKSRGIDPEPLVKPIDQAVHAYRGDNQSRGSIGVLRAPSVLEVFGINLSIPAKVEVGDRFHAGALLSMIEAQKHFYILALSQNRTRILECTQNSSEEIPFPEGFPASLADAMQTRKPDHVLDNGSAGGPSTGAMGRVMFGTTTDREDKDEYMLHFFMQLDRAVNIALKGTKDPLIAVGVEHEIALYRRVNTYPALVEPGVHGAADGLDGRDIHQRALELLEQQIKQPGNEVPADFDKRVGTGHASTHIQDIVAAAWEGRVSHLFFQCDAQYMGTFDAVRQRVKHTEDPLDTPIDLVESAAWQTILHGGVARVLPGAAMPKGVPVCALFRYPAPATVAAAGSPAEISS